MTSEFRSVCCRLAFLKMHKNLPTNRILLFLLQKRDVKYFSGSQKFYFVSRENLRWKPYCNLLGIVGVIYWRREILSDQCANHCDVTRLYFD